MKYSTKRIILSYLLFILTINYLPNPLNAENKVFTVKRLEQELLYGAEDHLDDSMDILSNSFIFQAIIELDTACIPTLTTSLESVSHIRKIIGGVGLGIIGNDEALGILKSVATKTNEDYMQIIYFMAISGRGTPSDLSVLMHSVKDKNNSALSNFAAYALATQHPELLKNENSAFIKDRNELLELIPVNGQKTNFETNSSVNDLITSLISHGIPRMNERNLFIDTKNNFTWELKGDTWYCTKGVDASISNEEISRYYKTAHISFNTYISEDQTRALVDVGLVFGGLNGSGFVYSLKKDKGKWKINYMNQTWIS